MDDMEAEGTGGAPAAGEQGEQSGATEICLAVAPDGSLSVYTEQPGGTGGAQNAQPAADIGAALQLILNAYKQMSAGQDAQAQFDQGFSGQGAMQSRMGGAA